MDARISLDHIPVRHTADIDDMSLYGSHRPVHIPELNGTFPFQVHLLFQVP